ncbi:Ig-like domain-containing protein, partial [Pedobacter agri]
MKKLLPFFRLLVLLLFNVNSFAQNSVSGLITDYNGFWRSSSAAPNAIKPDNRHHLLAFTWNGTTYSTGVNDAILAANGVSFSAQSFQAFPVRDVTFLPNGTSANLVALGKAEAGNNNYPYAVPVTASSILTRGVRGLDIGSAFTNIPSNLPLTFDFGAITSAGQLGDGIPDIIITQIAAAGGSQDEVWFEDGNGNQIGTKIFINMSSVTEIGKWDPFFFGIDNGSRQATYNGERPIRIWAADASQFGITTSNYTQPLILKYKLAGSSDPAFLAFNNKFISIVNANDDVASTNENTPININVIANDEPIPSANASTININSLAITQIPANGAVSVNTVNGVRLVSYTPNPGFTGVDTFKYQVCNSNATPQCDDATVTVNVGSADIQVTKSANTLAPLIGGNVVFTLTAKNNGPNTANNVSVRDVLPAGYTFVSTTPATGGFDAATSNWTVGSMANGATASITITARVNAAGPYANTANITTSTLDPIENNNSSTVTPGPVLSTNLAVNKAVDVSNPTVGSNVVFTVTAQNIGPSNATGVTVNDLLPNGYTFVSAVPATGTTYNAGSGVWNIGSLTSGATAITLTVTAKVNPTGTYVNTATISGAQPDPIPGNNTATATPVPVAQADLAITKTVSPTNPDVNSNVVFTIGLTNNGPSAATAVVINDVLPAGYSYVSSSASAGSYNNADGKWTLGTVNNAATAILSITAKVNATGAYRNTATASTATADPNSGNNTASATPTPVAITDLKITKTAAKDIINNAATVNPGDNETFTIVVTNTGPSAATNVVATDVIPNGYTFSNSSGSIGSYNQTTGKWTIGNLANGASATLTINAIINASGNYSNHVTLTGAEKDLDLSNNEAYAPLANTNADVSIVKTVNNVTPNVGANVTFTLVANNAANSTSDATQVTVTDILPSGYTYVSSSATLGTYNVANGVWYIGNLLKGSTQTLTLVAKVNPTGDYLNTTHVVATQSDPVPANNSSQALVMPVANADLAVVKTINSAELNNNRGVFTIVVSNNGPSTATNVIVNDVLPTGYTFTSSSATTGNYAAGVWTVGSLVSGASATLTLNSTLNSSGNYVNTATTSSATNDAISVDNTSSAQPAPLAPTGNASQTFCEIADAKVSNLVASGNSIKWYAAASGGTALAGTVALVNGSKYYATQTIAGAESVNRFEVTVTITATPAPTTTASTQTFCEITGATTSSLQITGTATKWYTAATGGTLLAATTPLANNTTYYASQTLNGCESKSRRAVTVAITTTAPPTGITSQTFCEISSPTINELVATATGLVKWYETANSTVALASTRPLVNGETYYSTQTLNGCESLSRFAVTVQISVVPPPTATTPQSFCASESAKISNLSASGSNVQWYNSSTGGSPLAITTPLVNGTTYYASQTVNGCESKTRTPVNVTINDNPTAAISGGGTVCAGAALPNVSITLTGTAPWNIIYNNGSSNISVTGITASPYVISNASAGTYTVTSVSNASCAGTSTGSAQVIVNPLPTVTVSGGGASCIGSPKSSVSFAFTGTAPFTFTYTDGTNAHTVTNTSVNPYVLTNPPVGNYSVSALTDATGCTGTFSGSAQVSENVIPTATISGGGVVCYGVTPPDVVVTLTGTAPFSFNYTVGSVTNAVTNYNSNTFNIVNPAEGTYSITQLHDANCTGAPASTTVSVVVINVPDVVITHPNCVNNNSGSIQVTSPLDPSIEYSIDNGTSWQSNPFFGNLAAGSFTVLARKGTCLSNPRAAVLDPAVNDPIISIVQPDCLNSTGTITVTAHPNQEYSLNGAAWVTTNVFSGLSNGTYTVKVRNTTTLCESNIANANINPQPATPNAPVSASPLNYCVDETARVLSATADGTNTLLWYNTATGGVGSTAAPTPVTNVAGLQEFYVSQRTSAGCESIRTKIEVNINALPAAPITDGDKETCEAVIMPTLTATAPAVPGFNIVWYNAASGGNIVANPTLNTVGTVTYYAAAQNATTGCLSATRTAVVLTINPTSTAPVSAGDQVVCATVPLQTLTATANTAAGNTVVWYDAPTGGNITTPTHHAIGTVTYYAASKNNGTNCESLTRTAVSLTINETPALPVGLDQTECAKTPLQTLTATASVQSGQSVVWYTAANAGNVVTDPSLSTSGTITYYAAAKDNATGCESLTRTPVVLTLRLPLTAGTISGNQEICRVGSGTVQPATLTFSAAPAGGATTYTYVWQSSLDNFATVLGNNLASTANYTPNPINTTTYYRVLITSGDCGTVTSNTVAISVKDAPTLTLAANASQSLCSTTSITNILYTWGGSATGAEASNLPNGLTATEDLVAKTLTISGTPNSSGTYTVITTGAIAPCTSQATITGTITVNPLPAAPTNTTANAVQCATLPTQTITATASAPGGSTVVWYDASSGGNIITPSLSTIGSVTFYAASKNNTTGCESASRTPVTLTINELPSVPSSGGNQTQCADANLQTLTATAVAPAGTTTVWYNAPSGGSVVVNPILNAVGSVTYYAASQDNFTGCLSTFRTPVSLTINSRSTASDLTVSSKSICAGQTTTLNATTSLVSPTFRWYATADLSIAPIHIGDNFTTPVLTSTTIYYVTVQGEGVCENLPNTALAVTVTINPLPTAAITGTTS